MTPRRPLRRHRGRDIAERPGSAPRPVLSDPNMVAHFKPGILEMIGPGVDLIFANEAEAKGMADRRPSRRHRLPPDPEPGLPITLGPKGALVFDGRS